MSDPLLPYYNRELAYLRNTGSEFARAHPKIAGRLGMSDDGKIEDPHVLRMIEAFAYLNARTRRKIEDDFPEITEALLGVLYPHYLAPFPSSSIVEFGLDRGQAELTSGHTIPRGATVETEPIDGQPCRFRTCYPVHLWPLAVKVAGFHGLPAPAPATPLTGDSLAVVRLELESFSGDVALGQFTCDTLRFFLNGSSPQIYELYELLLNNTLGLAVASSPTDTNPVMLGKQCLQAVGFERDEGLIDYSPRSFLGYRLLNEFFAFPEKFLFVDVQGLAPVLHDRFADQASVELFIYLDRHSQDLERTVTGDTFRLGCCPVVNQFRHRAEPIRLTHAEAEYRVVPDARRPAAHEISSVDRVVATSPDNEHLEYSAFYSIKHHRQATQERRFWHATRRPAGYVGGEVDRGTEVYLSLVDLDFQPSVPGEWVIDVETTCLNRDLPGRLPFGGGQPRLQLADGGSLAKVMCVTRPTPTLRPQLGGGSLWRLISHLSLNHLSLVDGTDGADALREILKLYDLADSPESRNMIGGILHVHSRRVVGRVGGPVSAGFCRGLEVTVHFDEEKFTGGGLFLFASVLNRFLGMYSSVNSFTKTVATTNRREGPLAQWPPRAGEKVLL